VTAAAQRGEIWLVDFGEPVGREQGYRRPAVIMSDDRLNRSRAQLAIVVPVTTTRRGLPSHIEIDQGDSGLKHASYAKAEDVKSVSTTRLIRRLGVIPAGPLDRTEHALRLLLGL
jgi:mRNA interferase MazF